MNCSSARCRAAPLCGTAGGHCRGTPGSSVCSCSPAIMLPRQLAANACQTLALGPFCCLLAAPATPVPAPVAANASNKPNLLSRASATVLPPQASSTACWWCQPLLMWRCPTLRGPTPKSQPSSVSGCRCGLDSGCCRGAAAVEWRVLQVAGVVDGCYIACPQRFCRCQRGPLHTCTTFTQRQALKGVPVRLAVERTLTRPVLPPAFWRTSADVCTRQVLDSIKSLAQLMQDTSELVAIVFV